MKVIYILWLRQIKRYYRAKSRIIGSIAQPLLFLLAFGFGFGPIFQKGGGGNYIQFLVPGIIAMGILFTAVFSGIEIIWDKQFGFLKETLVAPVSRLKIMIGRTLGGGTVAVIQGVIILAVSLFVGFHLPGPHMIILSLIFMALIAFLFAALGTVIASLLEDMQGFQLIMNFLLMPLFFLSGALFPLQGLPRVFTIIASMDPLFYGIEGLRGTLVSGLHLGLFHDFLILSAITAILFVIGSYLFSKIEI